MFVPKKKRRADPIAREISGLKKDVGKVLRMVQQFNQKEDEFNGVKRDLTAYQDEALWKQKESDFEDVNHCLPASQAEYLLKQKEGDFKSEKRCLPASQTEHLFKQKKKPAATASRSVSPSPIDRFACIPQSEDEDAMLAHGIASGTYPDICAPLPPILRSNVASKDVESQAGGAKVKVARSRVPKKVSFFDEPPPLASNAAADECINKLAEELKKAQIAAAPCTPPRDEAAYKLHMMSLLKAPKPRRFPLKPRDNLCKLSPLWDSDE